MQKTSTDGKGKGKRKGKECDDRGLKLPINYIAEDLTCTITYETVGDLYQLNCQHFISSKVLSSLQKPECPYCREEIKQDAVYYLPQQTIYKNIQNYITEAGSQEEDQNINNDANAENNTGTFDEHDDIKKQKKKNQRRTYSQF